KYLCKGIVSGGQEYWGSVSFPGNGRFPSRPCNRPGELITNCGTSCPKTCANRGQRIMCTMRCVPGCFCQLGLVRDYEGPWEHYTDCGTSCPKTCANMGVEMMCTMQCVSGCFCLTGMVRNYQGICVLPALCNLPMHPNMFNF
ncbi:unnamed protein product, partial [Medioppia subpectinata]